jgi:hypothetical protein
VPSHFEQERSDGEQGQLLLAWFHAVVSAQHSSHNRAYRRHSSLHISEPTATTLTKSLIPRHIVWTHQDVSERRMLIITRSHLNGRCSGRRTSSSSSAQRRCSRPAHFAPKAVLFPRSARTSQHHSAYSPHPPRSRCILRPRGHLRYNLHPREPSRRQSTVFYSPRRQQPNSLCHLPDRCSETQWSHGTFTKEYCVIARL